MSFFICTMKCFERRILFGLRSVKARSAFAADRWSGDEERERREPDDAAAPAEAVAYHH